MLSATTQGPISSLVLMIELTGQARAFALPMLIAIAGATLTARNIELRSIYEARLTDAEVAERARARPCCIVHNHGDATPEEPTVPRSDLTV